MPTSRLYLLCMLLLLTTSCGDDSAVQATSWSVSEGSGALADMATLQDARVNQDNGKPDQSIAQDQDAAADLGGEPLDLAGDWHLRTNRPQGSIVVDVYRFGADGMLMLLKRYDHPVGVVATCDMPKCSRPSFSTSCKFADRWRSSNASTLYVDLSCSDDMPRSARFAVSRQKEMYSLELKDVSGDEEWWLSASAEMNPLLYLSKTF